MADTVRYLMEAMLPELEDLARKGYFTRDEVRAIARRREDFEYALKRRSPVKADFLRCAEYERALDALRLHRRAALLSRASADLKAARGRLRGGEEEEEAEEGHGAAAAAGAKDGSPATKMTKAEARRAVARLRSERDALRRASPADHGARRRAHFAYERATRRFRRDASLWAAWLDYCRETRSGRRLSRVAARALRAMPREPGFWVAAAAWEFDGAGDPHAARALMQRGLRECRRDPAAAARMWEAYAGMEVAYVRRMRARREVLGLSLPTGEEEAAADAAAVEAARRGAARRAAEQEAEAAAGRKKSKGSSRKRRMPRDGGEEEDEEDDGSSSSGEDEDELGQDEDLEEEVDEDSDEEGGAKPRKGAAAAATAALAATAAELSKAGDDQAAADAVLRGAVVRAVVRAASRALPGDLALRLRLARMMDGGEEEGGSGGGGGGAPPFPGARRVADELWEAIAADFPASAAAWDARARRAFALASEEARAAGRDAGAAGDKAAAAVFERGVEAALAASAAAPAPAPAPAAGQVWAAYCAFLRERLDAGLERVAEASAAAASAAEDEEEDEAEAAAGGKGGKRQKKQPQQPPPKKRRYNADKAAAAAAAAAASAAAALAAARRAAALFKACARADAAFDAQQHKPWPLPPSFYADTWAGGARAAGQLAAAERAARLGAERRHPASARAWLALLEAQPSSGGGGSDSSEAALLARALEAVGLPPPPPSAADDASEEQQEEEEAAALARLWARAVAVSPPRAAAAFERLWASRSRRAGPPSGSPAGAIAETLLEALWRGSGGGGNAGPEAARALYARLRLLPPPGGELFRVMARLEASSSLQQQLQGTASAAALRRARAALEDGASTSYGVTDVRLWLQYAALAELGGMGKGKGKAGGAGAGGGGAVDVAALTAARARAKAGASGASAGAGALPTVGDVHFRAVRALGSGPSPRLADEFAAAARPPPR